MEQQNPTNRPRRRAMMRASTTDTQANTQANTNIQSVVGSTTEIRSHNSNIISTTPSRRSQRSHPSSQGSIRSRRSNQSGVQVPPVNLYDLIIKDEPAAINAIRSGNFIPTGLEKDIENRPGIAIPKGATYLMAACLLNKENVALELIKSEKSLPDTVDETNITALILSIINKMPKVAMAIIKTGNSNPGHISTVVSGTGAETTTALIEAAIQPDNIMNQVVVKLLQTGNSLPNYVDIHGNTALTLAIGRGNIKNAISIIKYDPSTTEHTDSDGETPLILALRKKYGKIAYVIADVGLKNTEFVSNNGNTALLYACLEKMEDIALAIVKTGKCNQFILHPQLFKTAGEIAETQNMRKVADAINHLGVSDLEININAKGTNIITQETMQIKSYLAESRMNICFKYNDAFILSNRDEIKKQISSPINIKYRCISVGDDIEYVADENINHDVSYFAFSSISGFQFVVPAKELMAILQNRTTASNLFCLTRSGYVNGLMSDAYLSGLSTVGVDNCGPGKKTEICHIIRAIPICGSSKETTPTTPTKLLEPVSNIIAQYGEKKVSLEYVPTQKIGELKRLVLEKLGEENKKVSFIFAGRVYRDDKDDELVSSITGLEAGKTILVRLTTTGGVGRKDEKRKTRRIRPCGSNTK